MKKKQFKMIFWHSLVFIFALEALLFCSVSSFHGHQTPFQQKTAIQPLTRSYMGESEDLAGLSEVEIRRRQRLKQKLAKSKSTKGDRVLDDFLGKKMGKGYVFYGAPTANLDDDEVAEMSRLGAEEALAEAPLKPNAILVLGATGATGQWVVLKLLDKGFNLRLFSRDLGRAEQAFGPDGANGDIFLGDAAAEEDLALAAAGAQAVVAVALGGRGFFGRPTFGQKEAEGVARLVSACRATGTVKKIVLMSETGASGARAEAEKALQNSGIDYSIVRASQLTDEPGGVQDIKISPAGAGGGGGGALSRMDAAEALVQALISDATSGVIFEAENTALPREAPRSYEEIDPTRAMELEIMEDIQQDEYWNDRFGQFSPQPTADE